MNPLASLAPALKDIASTQKTSFATTQAVWRFLNNENVSFQQLNLIYAELSGDFPLGDSRQPTYKSLRPFDLVS